MWPLLTLPQAGLLLLCSGVGALLLYRAAPRSKRVIVPFLPLWQAVLGPESAARRRSRPTLVGGWLVSCVVCTLFTLSLLAPAALGGKRVATTRLIVIDAGQHMRASDVRPTRFAQALERARGLIRAKRPEDQLLIAQLDSQFTPLGRLSTDPEVALQALTHARVTDATPGWTLAADFVLQLMAAGKRPVVTLISAGSQGADSAAFLRLRALGIRVEQLRVGGQGENVAIRSFSARRYADNQHRSELRIELENATDHPRSLELGLYGDTAPIAVDRIEVPAHGRAIRTFAELSTDAERIEARIHGADSLAADDHAYALLAPIARHRILLVSPGNRFLEAALLLDDALTVERVTPRQYQPSDDYDLVIFDRVSPEQPPRSPALYIAPGSNPRQFPFAVRGEVERPFFDVVAADEPLLRELSLRDVNLARAMHLQLTAADRALAATRTGVPLLISGERAGQRLLAFAFDLTQTDLPLRVAWPVLVLRSIEQLCGVEPDYQPSLIAGVEQRVRVADPEAKQARLSGPDRQQSAAILAQQGLARVRPVEAGFYSLQAGDQRQLLAVNRDPRSSAAITAQPLNETNAIAPVRAAFVTDVVGPWLWLALAWLTLLLEWYALRRGWLQ